MSNVKRLYIQYGCGLSCPDGWLNYDISPRLWIERQPVIGHLLRYSGMSLFPKDVLYGDIAKGLPHPPGSAAGIYCSHVLEHLDRKSVEMALANTFRLLAPGGIFRLIVPDMLWRARRFVAEADSGRADAADRFMRSSFLGQESPLRTLAQRLRAVYGNTAHRWMYDYGLMASLLKDAGFVGIRRCHLGDATDPMFTLVEDRGRFYEGANEELAIEARRA
ncbi:class I SAM-dependent methyltransferase [Methylococcus capsulatus]|uniref:class I SAM-dependent methyltransferase n=1 Tax=Methylococcus capsulatus TaxID=414 RepID=UPI001C529547|nr:methyltransferase domain-containing protein [Methylococcus capsulatus]QXP94870.1 methyltransferase domain-containing protein [Methylococcus capsulatus]